MLPPIAFGLCALIGAFVGYLRGARPIRIMLWASATGTVGAIVITFLAIAGVLF